MSRVAFSWRGRAARLAMAAAALLVVAVTSAVIAAQPATATWTSLSNQPTCDCVEQSQDGKSYRAVFSYQNTDKLTGHIEKGQNNAVYPATASGTQVTEFTANGTSTFATGWVAKDTEVVWSVGGKTVTANMMKTPCDHKISLPADGNGSGPILALAVSLLVTGGVVLVRRRRLKKLTDV